MQVARVPFFNNVTQKSDNGRRLVVRKQSAVAWRYTLEVRALRPWLSEPATLFDFFALHCGSYESFLYVDKFDNVSRRVHFVADDLGLHRENGGVYTGEFELEMVI